MITRPGFSSDNLDYLPGLPPPLCFTVPAANPRARGQLHRWAAAPVSLGTPRLMMDPSNPNTWQREYRFTQ
jgi:hypothetical protein